MNDGRHEAVADEEGRELVITRVPNDQRDERERADLHAELDQLVAPVVGEGDDEGDDLEDLGARLQQPDHPDQLQLELVARVLFDGCAAPLDQRVKVVLEVLTPEVQVDVEEDDADREEYVFDFGHAGLLLLHLFVVEALPVVGSVLLHEHVERVLLESCVPLPAWRWWCLFMVVVTDQVF